MSDPSFQDSLTESIAELQGQVVIIDTDSHFVYLGELVSADRHFLKLDQVDVHELTKASLSKERYVHEAGQIGVRPNRRATWVRMDRVVSISRLADVQELETP